MSLTRIARRDLVWSAVMLLLITIFWVADGDRAEAGAPPAEGIDLVYIAVSTDFPDSLGLGPGAASQNAPILLVPTDPPIPDTTKDELTRLDPKRVTIIGGTAVVSAGVEGELASLLPNATIDRVSGPDRYSTNTAFTGSLYPLEGWASIAGSAFGSDYSDDLVGKSITSAYNQTTGNLEASIQLPHGATILEFKVWFYDDVGGGDVTAYLYRLEPGVSAVQMAEVDSSGLSGEGAVSDTTIYHGDDPVIEPVDNSVYTYGVSVTGADQVNRMIRQAMVRYRLGATP
ncbi:MAG TPA: cell wall-binding repeat-containing protein [Acidimicrobiia bacterium]|nr:cell wall-binding repeat-containing protein [Acidimicrobiia bacterium]